MKIATWNIERLENKKHLDEILMLIKKANPDILVLTETSAEELFLDYRYTQHTTPYKEKTIIENRVSIYSKTKIINAITTYNDAITCAAEIATPLGNLIVYGTIMGIQGNRHRNFKEDLPQQLNDISKLSKQGNICVLGDYNISFSDEWYFTHWGREQINNCFERNGIQLPTAELKNCIDHIGISDSFAQDRKISIEEFNVNEKYFADKRLSDHKGTIITLG